MNLNDIKMEDVLALPRDEKINVLAMMSRYQDLQSKKKLFWLYPEEDTIHNEDVYHSRYKYLKHLEFFKSGKTYPERCAMCANRIGKSFGMGGYETALHVTGLYPDWWEGYTFHRPIKVWIAGKNNTTTRDICQNIMCGSVSGSGSNKFMSGDGLIPAAAIKRLTWQRGTADMLDTMRVDHITDDSQDGESLITYKSFERGRGSFEGDAIDVIWLDEECPPEVYEECLYRTMTTGGLMYLTFTPVEGLTPTVLQFLPDMNPDA